MTTITRWRRADGQQARVSQAIYECPGCGREVSIGMSHTIGSDGVVTPSAVCRIPNCSFHEYITLEGWVPQ